MRITKIKLKDYRAFHSQVELDLGIPGRNVLIYGENGSGKSSIYHALNEFLEASMDNRKSVEQQRYIFTNNSEPRVELDINGLDENGDYLPGSKTYVWSTDESPYENDLVQGAAKTKGFLDYRALLKTHFLQWDNEVVDLFPLLMETAFRDMPNPITKEAFGTEWRAIQSTFDLKQGVHVRRYIKKLVSDFNHGFVFTLGKLSAEADQMIRSFGHGLNLSLWPKEEVVVKHNPKELGPAVSALHVEFSGVGVLQHHRLLNEARLSAIAIVLYLAGLKLNPSSEFQLLVLDDILIGLDMANRLPVLRILQQHFRDRQVFLFTHDKMWYEFVRLNTAGDKTWCYFEMGSHSDHDGIDRPWIRKVEDGINEFLKRAVAYLADNDQNASALSARMAFEAKLKNYADKRHLAVPYRKDERQVSSEEFWSVVIPDALERLKTKPEEHLELTTCKNDIEAIRKVILNPLSHGNAVSIVRSEVELAITAVRKLCAILKA